MNKINSLHLNCPQCRRMMTVKSLGCDHCQLTLQGQFESHPLMELDGEMLHFLHVFIMCEGKIADMEKALGISYPTVKNKIQKLKEAVSKSDMTEKESTLNLESKSVIEILDLIDKGIIDYKLGLTFIKSKS